ncbi:MAG: holo-ACP synthase [Phycisphaeraceae bacterium]|nr:holo-ACP synthase [Phycisphaeraceae bacterium]
MCGYSLAEVRGTNCPECGRERNQPQSALLHHRIVSHGIDLIEVSRIAGMIDRHNDHFLHRVFTDHEQEYSRKSKRCNEHLAARFAAKEAVMKALGTGWRNGIAWTDIEVVSLASGAPVIKLHGKAKQTADDLGIQEWLVSLTHTKENAMASVIALKQSVSTQSQSISPAARS